MFVDIHTHRFPDSADYTFIYNLPLADAQTYIDSAMMSYFSIGFHPWYIMDEFSELYVDKIRNWVNDKRVVAIGECGLDRNTEAALEKQIQVFEQQVILSEKKEKPLIIHCVGHFNELFELKKQWKPKQKWIIHGFRGKPQLAEQALKAGCDLSFGEYFNPESIKVTPVENLYIETDESTLPIKDIYCNIANVKGCSIEDLNAGWRLLNEKF